MIVLDTNVLSETLKPLPNAAVIPFDRDCAEAYAAIAANRKNLGQPISQFDAMIAAATASRGATLATRNERDFADCGIRLINPWET